jgi:ubiquitin-activating enzyme E1
LNLDPFCFSIGDLSSLNEYESGGRFVEVKKEKIVKFVCRRLIFYLIIRISFFLCLKQEKSFKLYVPFDFKKKISEASVQPEYVPSDYSKLSDNDTIHLAFQVIWRFKHMYHRLPKPWCAEDAQEFVDLVKHLNSNLPNPVDHLNEDLLKLFSYVCAGNLCPIQSVIGGIVAQEIMKASSGKFHPIVQYFYFDARECLPSTKLNDLKEITSHHPTAYHRQKSIKPDRYIGQINVFGENYQDELLKKKSFLVGAGALGCEYLKNFAMMGLCCSNEGKLTVTDMDTIEKSNLNRQFLFRSWDIHKSKSEVAVKAAKHMNEHLNVEAHLNSVGCDTESIYSEDFFDSLDIVCSALDNLKARLYIDERCVKSRKPLVESGTLGTEGNVQVVVPYLTESYSSSQDPPEKSIPMCTLKLFPNSIEHTIEWARDMFQGLFFNTAVSALNYAANPNEWLHSLSKTNRQHQLEELVNLKKTLVTEKCENFHDCISWARQNWQENFHNKIEQLLLYCPPEQKTNTGAPFWSSPKRCPHSLEFDFENELHLDYVYAAANLKAALHHINQLKDRHRVKEMLKNIHVTKFKPKESMKMKLSDLNKNEANSNDQEEISDEDDKMIDELKAFFDKNKQTLTKHLRLKPIEFEKDNDENLHMDFITSCSNLRAENYDIASTDKHNVN